MMSHFRKPAKAAAASGKQQAGGQKPPDPNAADISGALAGLQELSSAAAAMQSMAMQTSPSVPTSAPAVASRPPQPAPSMSPVAAITSASIPSPAFSPVISQPEGTPAPAPVAAPSPAPPASAQSSSPAPSPSPSPAAGATGSAAPAASAVGGKRKRLFTRELRMMLYGFGDVQYPLTETVNLVEDLALEYIQEMTAKAMQVAAKRGRLQTEDIVFLIRKDRKKHARVIELLRMYDELKKAKKAFEIE